MPREYRPSKIKIIWNTDHTLSFYASKKMIMRIKMYDRFEEAIKPVMQGWFKSDNPKDWRYRVVIRDSKKETKNV